MTLAEDDFPTDVRVENEARRLLDEGHQVTIVARQLTHRERNSHWQGIEIIRIPRLPSLLRQVHALVRFRFHFNIVWFLSLALLHRRENFDVFHVHDLPLAGTGLFLGRLVHRPVLLDFHENYPVALQTYQPPAPDNFWQKVRHKLFYDLHRWKRYEQSSVLSAEQVIVVVEEARERLHRLGVAYDRITVVSNTLNIAHFEQFPTSQDLTTKYADKFIISYVGTAARYRFIQTIIRAMPSILRSIHNAHFLIVGNADRHTSLHKLVNALGMSAYVTFTGQQPFSQIPSYIVATTVGVLPHQSNEHTQATIPHKLFQYMYCKKPVIVSNCAPLARVVSETGCGLVCDADIEDAEAWAAAIISLDDPDIREQMGQRGRQAVLEKHNWHFDAERLAGIYQGLKNTGESA